MCVCVVSTHREEIEQRGHQSILVKRPIPLSGSGAHPWQQARGRQSEHQKPVQQQSVNNFAATANSRT
jgi:hypothetical protein